MKSRTQSRLNKHSITADNTLPARPRDAARLTTARFKEWETRRTAAGTLTTALPKRNK